MPRHVNSINRPDASSPDAITANDHAALMRDILTAQILRLDTMFAELVGDAASSRPYLDSTATYTRLALRAQSNCRASLQAVERVDRAERLDAEK